MVFQTQFRIQSQGRSTLEITDQLNQAIAESGYTSGICNIFIQHTSASLIITENADPTVRVDLETILQRLAPDGDPEYRHDYEGDDDMSAHIRCMLTNDSLSVPVTNGRLALGTWQGVFLYEHRYQPHHRKIIVTIMGDIG
jgi:secondary thiamine-phosphate synthase enzyme